MQIFTICPPPYAQRRLKKLLIIMKLTTLLMIIGCIHVSAAGYSQKINLSERNVSLNSVFSKMEKQSGYHFFSNSEFIAALPNVSVSIKNATLSEALNEILSKVSLSYSIVDKTVVITPLSETVNGIKKAVPLLVIGVVLDEQGKPLPGVNIKIKGTIQRTTTDQDGKFRIIALDESPILEISYVGYQNKEVAVKGLKNPLIIKLQAASADLDQVQILAYSTTTKRNNIGSTYTIGAKELAKNPVPNVLQMIENRIPGVSVTQNTGQVGGSFVVQIRGINGTGNVDPLYIIDGVPYPAGGNNGYPGGANISGALPLLNGPQGNNSAQRGGNALNYINPNDIESIDVLKDADATSIYGSRGAYGVVLITTKKAKAGAAKLTLNINRGIAERGSTPELLGTADYLMLRREAIKNDKTTVGPGDPDLNGTWDQNANTNWVKELAGDIASQTRLYATYGGGNENSSYLVSGSFNNIGNITALKGGNSDGGMRFNINTTTPDKKVSLNFTGAYNSTVNTMVQYDFSGDGTTLRAPNAPSLYLPDGSLNWSTGVNTASIINTKYKGVTNNLLSSLVLKYTPIKGLDIVAQTGYSLLNIKELNQVPTTYYDPSLTTNAANSNSNSNNLTIRSWNVNPYITYTTKIGSKGTLVIRTSATLDDKLNYSTAISGTGFASDALLGNPTAGQTVNSSFTNVVYRNLRYGGGLNYNWASKYFISVNASRDGSTKFGPGNRFGTFGSIGAGYIFTQEKWIKETLPFLSFGKLKGSYGTAGGDGIGNYLYLASYSTLSSTYAGGTALIPSALANDDLHWEKNKKTDIGLSLGFLKDKIILDADYYKNITTDQLLSQPISSVTGYVNVTKNIGAVLQNTGFEFSLSTHNMDSKNFSWSTNANFTVPKNKVISLPAGIAPPNPSFVVGLPISNIKLLNYVGVDPQTGLYNFINAKGVKGTYILFKDPVTLDPITDRTQNLTLGPVFYGALSNSFRYKSFTLDFTFSLEKKTGLNYLGQQQFLAGGFNQNVTTLYLQRWQKPGDITDVPRAATFGIVSAFSQSNFTTSTGAYETVLFSKLQNVSISYSFTSELLKKIHVSNMNIMLQGQNLLVISKYGDLDPENLSATALPALRIYNLSLNLTF